MTKKKQRTYKCRACEREVTNTTDTVEARTGLCPEWCFVIAGIEDMLKDQSRSPTAAERRKLEALLVETGENGGSIDKVRAMMTASFGEKLEPEARPAPHLAAYFMQRIPVCPSSDLKLLEAFPCDDSAVAEACVAAIDSAAALYEHVLKTTGNDYPDRNEAVARVALQICLGYAF